jgi:hypothetical protein
MRIEHKYNLLQRKVAELLSTPRTNAKTRTASHSHDVSDLAQSGATTNQVLAWGGLRWEPTNVTSPAPSLSSTSAFLASNLTMSAANTWYTGPQVTLASGTWLVMASATIGRTATTAGHYNIRISNGLTHYASVQQYHASVAANYAALSCNAIITLTASTTIGLYASGTIAADVLYAATPNNTSGNTATGIVAIKIA